jgi:hypothetical protein
MFNERPSEIGSHLLVDSQAATLQFQEAVRRALDLSSQPNDARSSIVGSSTATSMPMKDVPTIRVTPKPGFVIKTKRITNQSKVFINITTDGNVRYKAGK